MRARARLSEVAERSGDEPTHEPAVAFDPSEVEPWAGERASPALQPARIELFALLAVAFLHLAAHSALWLPIRDAVAARAGIARHERPPFRMPPPDPRPLEAAGEGEGYAVTEQAVREFGERASR